MKRTIALLALSLIFISSVQAQEANWITADDSTCNERNVWIEFRKDFDLKKKVKKAEARIAADSKYWLWINGEMAVFEGGLKRGPNRNDSYYDIIDLAPYLKKGKNDIRLLLWYFGKSGFSHNSSGKSGIIFDAPGIGLASDRTWLSQRLDAFQTADKPKPNYRLSEANIRYDARLEGQDRLKPSVEIGRWGDQPWGDLVLRPIPQWKDYGIVEVAFTETSDDQGNKVLAARLPYNTQMTPVIDVTDAAGGTLIRMETDHIMGGSEPCIRAEYITKEGRQKYESLGWMNGDELRIIYPAESGIVINSVGYRETGYDCEFEGRFTCSDETINRFWGKAMRTLYVNMRDTYFDCPDRERAQWWGDVTVLIGQSFYQLSPNANALVRKAIHELVDWQRADGTIYSPVPSGTWKNELPAQMLSSVGPYGFWYYYMHTGDKETMEYVYPAVRKYLSVWTLDEDGLTVGRKGGWSWGDWGTNIDLRLLLAAWHYLALQAATDMAELTGNEADIPEYTRIRESIYKAFNTHWNGYAYRYPSYQGATDDRVQAMAILSGLADEDKHEQIFQLLKTQKHASPYMEKYVLEALVKKGHGDFAIERFKKRFGPMIADNLHTTLFEGWEEGGYGGGSTNHAWSGGMLTVIAENICGVRPTVPGWKEFEICPYPVISECSITIPSVAGMISSSFKDNEEAFVMNVSIPKGTTATVVVPQQEYSSITLGGKPAGRQMTLKEGEYEIVCRK
ncbi:MAG: glycoside hydrolase [Bacteroidales bacterium]|nr:glycoside hydrolase [Bacteroidales bacterium]